MRGDKVCNETNNGKYIIYQTNVNLILKGTAKLTSRSSQKQSKNDKKINKIKQVLKSYELVIAAHIKPETVFIVKRVNNNIIISRDLKLTNWIVSCLHPVITPLQCISLITNYNID